MIICFQNISEDKRFDKIYLCTEMDVKDAFNEIKKIRLDDIIEPDGYEGYAFEDPFLLSYIYFN